MLRLAPRLLYLLAAFLIVPYAPLAQTLAQNDKAAAFSMASPKIAGHVRSPHGSSHRSR